MNNARTSIPFPCAILWFLISLFVLHTRSLVLIPSVSLTLPTNLSGLWSYQHCVSDTRWNPRTLDIAPSCENALVALSDESTTWGLNPGIFTYRPGARSTAFFPGARSFLTLPKRYVSGDCVVAIVMMKMFEHSSTGQFPGLPDSLIGKWRSRDTSTWKDLLEPASYVRATCGNGCGYTVSGKGFGIGIAIWGTGSKWDRYAREIASLSKPGEVIPALDIGNTSVLGVSNGSVLSALR